MTPLFLVLRYHPDTSTSRVFTMVLKALVDPSFGSSGASPGLSISNYSNCSGRCLNLNPLVFTLIPLPEMTKMWVYFSDLALNDRKCVRFFGGRPHKYTLVSVCYEQSQMKQFCRE